MSLAISKTEEKKRRMFSSYFPIKPALLDRGVDFWHSTVLGETQILQQPGWAHDSAMARALWCLLSPREVTVHKRSLLVFESTVKSKGQWEWVLVTSISPR